MFNTTKFMSMIVPSTNIERCIVPIDMVTLPLKSINEICCCIISLVSIPMSNKVDKYNKSEELPLSTKILRTSKCVILNVMTI